MNSCTGRAGPERYRILFLNWRDRTHPKAGGAEEFLAQTVRRLAGDPGIDVTVFTARPPGSPKHSHENGIHTVRRGGGYSVYVRAALYLLRHRRRFDAVIDIDNGIPFFSPLVAGRRRAVIRVVHHVHQEQFGLRMPWPLRELGRALEGPVAAFVYRKRPTIAVSPSTRMEIRHILGLSGPIYVIPNGSRDDPGHARAMTRHPSIAVVSRLVAHKRIDLLLDTISVVRRRHPELRVDIVGTGEEETALTARSHALGIDDIVTFHGWADEATRDDIIGRAWLTVITSQREGWGLTVVEANMVGVPAVACDVAGLRDSIRNGVTGWLAPSVERLPGLVGDALDAMAEPAFADEMAGRCRDWARRFSWDHTARELITLARAETLRIRARGLRQKRVANDVTIVLDVSGADPMDIRRSLRAAVRTTDRCADTADGAQAMLIGCDETDALRVISRLPTGVTIERRLALTDDVLLFGRDAPPAAATPAAAVAT